MKIFRAVLLTLLVAVPITWFATRQFAGRNAASTKSQALKQGERKLMYYQSAMHPWIKSDKPGRCTICGMELTPVYEGDADSAGGDIVPLSQTMVQALNVQTAEAKIGAIEKTLSVAGVID